MTDKNAAKRIAQLLQMAWSTKSKSRVLSITGQILELDPDNSEALLLRSDFIDNVGERQKTLRHALAALDLQSNQENILLALAINQRLAHANFVQGDLNEALINCNNAIEIANDLEDCDEVALMMKSLRYRILIERRDWPEILTETMKDNEQSLAWAYARMIAAWQTAGVADRQRVCAPMFWDALIKSPDVPFYVLGFFEEPGDDASPEVLSDFDFALLFYDTVSVTDEFYGWYSRGVILFGLLSGRFEEQELDYMIDALDSVGGYDDYQRMKAILVETEDAAVIEALAANKCLIDY